MWQAPSKVETPEGEAPRGLLPEGWLCGSPSPGRRGPHGVGVGVVEESSLDGSGVQTGSALVCALRSFTAEGDRVTCQSRHTVNTSSLVIGRQMSG